MSFTTEPPTGEADVLIRIALPLPVDVVSTIMLAISDVYPGSVLAAPRPDVHELVLSVSESDRRAAADRRDDLDNE